MYICIWLGSGLWKSCDRRDEQWREISFLSSVWILYIFMLNHLFYILISNNQLYWYLLDFNKHSSSCQLAISLANTNFQLLLAHDLVVVWKFLLCWLPAMKQSLKPKSLNVFFCMKFDALIVTKRCWFWSSGLWYHWNPSAPAFQICTFYVVAKWPRMKLDVGEDFCCVKVHSIHFLCTCETISLPFHSTFSSKLSFLYPPTDICSPWRQQMQCLPKHFITSDIWRSYLPEAEVVHKIVAFNA